MVCLVSVLPACWIHLTCDIIPEDDAFITYRYAQNIVEGHGPVYNAGERVFGSSTPLYVVWLVGLKSVAGTFSLPVLSVRFNFLPFIALVLGTAALCRSLTGRTSFGAVAAVYVACHPDIIGASIAGMESVMFLAFLVWAYVYVCRGRVYVAAVLLGAATLCRLEGVVAMLALCVWMLWQQRQSLLRVCLIYSAVGAIWVLPAIVYFGTAVPHSVIAKSAPLYPVAAGFAAAAILEHVTQWMTVGVFERLGGAQFSLTFLLCLVPLSAVLTSGIQRQRPILLVGLLFVGLIGFYSISNPMMMEWYWVLPQYTLLLVCVCGGSVVLETVESIGRPRWVWCVRLVLLAWAVLLVGTEWNSQRKEYAHHQGRWVNMERDLRPDMLRIQAYLEAGEWLSRRDPFDGMVAGSEIGALGFAYKGPILDTCGLVSPRAVPFHPVPSSQRASAVSGAIPKELIFQTHPAFVVTMPGFARHGLFSDARFDERYERVHKVMFPRPVWGSHSVLIYQRRSKIVGGKAVNDVGVSDKHDAPAQAD